MSSINYGLPQYLSQATQTQYRDSEAQTYPWDPPINFISAEKQKEVSVLKQLDYGRGLPVSPLEIQYLSNLRSPYDIAEETEENDFDAEKRKIHNELKSRWNYKVAVLNQNQADKLERMKYDLLNELKLCSEKKEKILRNNWMRKKKDIEKQNYILEEKLYKGIRKIKSFLDNSQLNPVIEINTKKKEKMKPTNLISEKEDFLLSNYYFSDPIALASVKNWLEKQPDTLNIEVPLPKCFRNTQRERLAAEAYDDLLASKRSKLPPEKLEKKVGKENEVFDVPVTNIEEDTFFSYEPPPEKKRDPVIVWQQTLRGLAYQKQMLELIERHKEGLKKSLPKFILQ